MSIQHVTESLQSAFGAPQKVIVEAGPRFSDNLRLGDVIKGKVLRHYEGSRYAVSFGSEERVVDSSVPLTTDEIVVGRVIGLGERVTLQRLPAAPDRAARSLDQAPGLEQSRRPADVIEQIFDRYNTELRREVHGLLARTAGSTGRSDAAAHAGLILARLGLPLEEGLLRALFDVIRDPRAFRTFARSSEVAMLEPSTPSSGEGDAASKMLAGIIEASLDPAGGAQTSTVEPAESEAAPTLSRDSGMAAGGDLDRRRDRPRPDLFPGRRLLNVQSGGAVAHRLGTVPLLLGDRLIEVDVALFSQKRESGREDGIRHRKIVFSLQTEFLGTVQITVRASKGHLRIAVATTRSESTTELARHRPALRAELGRLGWAVDEFEYSTFSEGAEQPAVWAVVEHYCAQNSLNSVM